MSNSFCVPFLAWFKGDLALFCHLLSFICILSMSFLAALILIEAPNIDVVSGHGFAMPRHRGGDEQLTHGLHEAPLAPQAYSILHYWQM